MPILFLRELAKWFMQRLPLQAHLLMKLLGSGLTSCDLLKSAFSIRVLNFAFELNNKFCVGTMDHSGYVLISGRLKISVIAGIYINIRQPSQRHNISVR